MITVDFKVESRYRIDRERVKQTIIASLAKNNVFDDYEVSVVVCGERRIKELHRIYMERNDQAPSTNNQVNPKSKIKNQKLNELPNAKWQMPNGPDDELHDVLSFPLDGEKSPDGTLMLGDIVLCYPQVLKAASEHNRMVDEEIDFLVDHACLHLLGIHHEE